MECNRSAIQHLTHVYSLYIYPSNVESSLKNNDLFLSDQFSVDCTQLIPQPQAPSMLCLLSQIINPYLSQKSLALANAAVLPIHKPLPHLPLSLEYGIYCCWTGWI